MSRPKRRNYDLRTRLELLRRAGLTGASEASEQDKLLPLEKRIKKILNILRDKPKKPLAMLYLIMYDIENDKVRNRISRYLERKGCVRIQKSVFVARTEPKVFEEIHETLREVQSFYDNRDSIILVPANSSDLRSMKIIGKELYLEAILDKPNSLFF
ncbi:MAG: CRISPR-associated endonuclease Cas2 [Chitinophagales bacterium]|nr:CRISPR-associated endonuclease Cas2 [Chitinophagales bacterium]MDW8427133.1 CRISPR-associated endonuclease Cas2 [Chitinophagales bacterium]